MSPCVRCVLYTKDKNNNVCRTCEARYRYASEGVVIGPPDVDLSTVEYAFATVGGASPKHRGVMRRRKLKGGPIQPCSFPGCERTAMIDGLCDVCYKRKWRRKRLGIPEFASIAEARRIGQRKRREAGA